MTTTIRKRLAVASLALALLPAVASTSDSMTLKEIMQGLREDAVQIADGLLTENFEQIAQAADAIADHPKIPAEHVQLVMAELGDEMPTFKLLDTLVHDLAVEVGAAARSEDLNAAAAAYHEMFQGCLACHDAYQERVAAALQPATQGAGD